ncbi:MAG: AMP-binding protein [Acidimicrobiales bacterium]|nr:AMP-binding protein [Acidimicrobiales bacterium]
MIATSGTTGSPKAIVHTHSALLAHAQAVGEHLEIDATRDRWLACLPLAHIGGLGVVIRSLLTATPCDVLGGFDAATVGAAPEALGSTLVSLVPTALDRIDATRFRRVVLGGSADPASDRPSNVVATYGSTETGGGIVYGDTALPGVEVRVGTDDVIEVRGPTLTRGRRQEDGRVVPVTDDQGWFRTGDVGRMLDPARRGGSQRLEVLGRVDDLIITGGQNVWPTPVEVVLGMHRSIQEVAVYGRPDPEWGQVVVAEVVLRPDAPRPSLEELRDFVRAELPAYAAPKAVEFRTALPRTALGKVRRTALGDGRGRPPSAGPGDR